jgi:hypothetical protein
MTNGFIFPAPSVTSELYFANGEIEQKSLQEVSFYTSIIAKKLTDVVNLPINFIKRAIVLVSTYHQLIMKKFILTIVSFLLVNCALRAQGSMSFNGSSNYALIPTSATLDPGTGSYTAEFWMRYSSASSNSWPRVFQVGSYPNSPIGLSIEGGTFYVWENGYPNGVYVADASYHNTWVHVAISRSGNTTRLFLDGTQIHSFSSFSNILFGNKPMSLGVEYDFGSPGFGTYFNGNITNFRFIKSAQYTANFTKPTSPFPTTSPTPLVLLLSTNSGGLLTNSGSFSTTLSNSGVTYSSLTPFGPVITPSATTLTNFAPCSGSVSNAQTFTFTGSNLTSAVTVTAPANFQVSSNGSTFVNSFTVPASGTSIASTTVWVRSTTSASGTLSGSVTLSATNASTQSIALSGSVLTTPVLSVTNGSRCGTGTVALGATSTQSGTVSWFSSVSGGSALATGTSYTTPSISATTTYFVSGNNGCYTSSPRQAVTATINEVPTITGSSIGYINQQTLLTGSGTPASSSTWATSNSAIATVSGTNSTTGTVTGVATGSATITYRNSSNCTNTSSITVYNPTITTSTSSLSAFTACQGSASAAQTFTVSGTSIPVSILVTAPTGFEVSTNASSGYGSSFTLNAVSGTVSSTTVHIRLAASATGTPSGTISITSTNATTRTVSVSGTVTASPVVTVTDGSRCGTGTVVLGATATNSGTVSWFADAVGGSALATGTSYTTASISATTTYHVSASNSCHTTARQAVVATVNSVPTITGSSTGFVGQQVTLTGSGTPATTATWTSSNASVATVSGTNSTTGTVSALTTGSTTITYNNASGCSTTQVVTVYNPSITVSATSLSAFTACTGTASTEQSFTVSGTSIPTSILVTAPTGFEVSTSAASGYSGSVTLNASSGTVSSTTVYARMAASASGTPSGSIDVTSNQATTKTVSLTGTLSTVPTVSGTDGSRCGAGAVILTATATQSGTLNWYETNISTTSLHTGGTYQPTVALGTTTYYVGASNSCGTSTSRSAVVATAFGLPDAPTVTNGQRCGTGTVALSADGGSKTVRWYASGGTTVLSTGTSYTTPSISTTTNYNVDALSADGCVSATKSLATATVSNTATWNSASSQSWTTAANWSCGTVPDGSVSLIISTGTATLSSDLAMASGTTLTLASGAYLEIDPGTTLTIETGATLTNGGTVRLNALGTSVANLWLKGDYDVASSGEVVVEHPYDVASSSEPWVHVSSPVTGSLSHFGSASSLNSFSWNATTGSWYPESAANSFQAGRGYVLYMGASGVQTATSGVLEAHGTPFSNVSLTLGFHDGANNTLSFAPSTSQPGRKGWNLLGNPFTSRLDFVAVRTATGNGINNSFARWNPTKGGQGNGGFDVYAGASADYTDASIPPMGAAWVQITGNSIPSMSGNLTQGTHGRKNGANFSKGAGVDKLKVIVTELAAPVISDEMSLAMVPGASDGFDSDWDGRELLNGLYMPNLFVHHLGDRISAKAVDFNLDAVNAKVVPVGMSSTQEMKPYRIHLDESWAQPGYTVYLKDHLLKNVHKLSTSDYVFAYSSAMEDRFELILTNAKTGALGLEEASRGALTAWVSGSDLWITGLESGAQEIDIVGMDGRVVLSTALRAEEGQAATTALPELPAGLYTVRVRANGLERGVRFAVQR